MAFRTQKISQMTPKGADLEATDLIEVSTIESGSYVTRSITGQELIDAIPPTTIEWGAIGGTLSNQTDLQSALDAKVPTSRTLTINGVTQDLSANRTFTISTGITIGSTAIASGVVGRVLFEGAGNVVQESSSLFFDDTAKSFTLSGNQNAITSLTISNSNTGSSSGISSALLSDTSVGNSLLYGSGRTNNNVNQYNTGASYIIDYQGPVGLNIASTFASSANSGIRFWTAAGTNNGVERMRIFSSTGNIGVNTTTDAGFRLDVNGTARVQSLQILSTGNFGFSITRSGTSGIAEQIYNNGGTTYLGADSSAGGFLFTGGLPYASFFGNGANYPTQFGTNSATRMTIFAGGNVGINTTTDAGFRLDVNGTARVQGDLTIAKNQNAPTRADIINTTSGTSAYTEYRVSPNSASSSTASFGKYSSTTTAFKFVSANDAYIFNGNSGDIAILNDNLTGRIKFGAGGASTAQMTLKASGVLNLSSVPTSPAGLSSGDVWNNLGVLMIV